MKIVVALGGNALVKRGETVSADVQKRNIKSAVHSLALLVENGHQLIITHGNGPHIGALAEQSAASGQGDPIDAVNAQSVGMISYLIELEFRNALTNGEKVASVLTQVEIDPHDRAFENPSKPIGVGFGKREAEALAVTKRWTIMRDGEKYRRSIASPMPKRIVEVRAIKELSRVGFHVICGGGGGIPVCRRNGKLEGVEAVVDKDHTSALIGVELGADALLLLTDVDGVYKNWGSPQSSLVPRMAVDEAARHTFALGSMAPKVKAATDFVSQTGKFCGIGKLEDAGKIISRQAGTAIMP